MQTKVASLKKKPLSFKIALSVAFNQLYCWRCQKSFQYKKDRWFFTCKNQVMDIKNTYMVRNTINRNQDTILKG